MKRLAIVPIAKVAAFALALVGGVRTACLEHGLVRAAHAEDTRPVASDTEQVSLIVEGMHCATCPLTVRVTLERLDGVRSAKVSMKEGKAYVVYDPAKVSPDQMAKAVTEAGYPTKVAGRS
jgi:mercuric ion binding protein